MQKSFVKNTLEILGINRAAADISSKPPSTIEWE